jgi:hypothetical protein
MFAWPTRSLCGPLHAVNGPLRDVPLTPRCGRPTPLTPARPPSRRRVRHKAFPWTENDCELFNLHCKHEWHEAHHH